MADIHADNAMTFEIESVGRLEFAMVALTPERKSMWLFHAAQHGAKAARRMQEYNGRLIGWSEQSRLDVASRPKMEKLEDKAVRHAMQAAHFFNLAYDEEA